jgi:hypothetical protein
LTEHTQREHTQTQHSYTRTLCTFVAILLTIRIHASTILARYTHSHFTLGTLYSYSTHSPTRILIHRLLQVLAHAKFVLPGACFAGLEFIVAPGPAGGSVRLARVEKRCRVSLKAK